MQTYLPSRHCQVVDLKRMVFFSSWSNPAMTRCVQDGKRIYLKLHESERKILYNWNFHRNMSNFTFLGSHTSLSQSMSVSDPEQVPPGPGSNKDGHFHILIRTWIGYLINYMMNLREKYSTIEIATGTCLITNILWSTPPRFWSVRSFCSVSLGLKDPQLQNVQAGGEAS